MRRISRFAVIVAVVVAVGCQAGTGPTTPAGELSPEPSAAELDSMPADPLPEPSPMPALGPRHAASTTSLPGIAKNAADRIAVCHRTGNGSYRLIHPSSRGWNGHQRHGDASPGEAVPGMDGFVFDDACAPVPDDDPGCDPLTGDWVGTYSWDCGGDRTGSVPIEFVLVDECSGRLSGQVEYLGATSAVGGFRARDVTYDNWGIQEHTIDANGSDIFLQWQAVPGHFVYQEFSGVLAPGGDLITGITLNGDSPVLGSEGCSHPTGGPDIGSGTFRISRVGS